MFINDYLKITKFISTVCKNIVKYFVPITLFIFLEYLVMEKFRKILMFFLWKVYNFFQKDYFYFLIKS